MGKSHFNSQLPQMPATWAGQDSNMTMRPASQTYRVSLIMVDTDVSGGHPPQRKSEFASELIRVRMCATFLSGIPGLKEERLL